MLKKKRYKFQVELQLDELNAVTFPNAVLFSKIRLLDGGNFCEISSRSVEMFDSFVVVGCWPSFSFTLGHWDLSLSGSYLSAKMAGCPFTFPPFRVVGTTPKTEHFSESKSQLYCSVIYVTRTLIRLFGTVGAYAAAVYESKEQSSR